MAAHLAQKDRRARRRRQATAANAIVEVVACLRHAAQATVCCRRCDCAIAARHATWPVATSIACARSDCRARLCLCASSSPALHFVIRARSIPELVTSSHARTAAASWRAEWWRAASLRAPCSAIREVEACHSTAHERQSWLRIRSWRRMRSFRRTAECATVSARITSHTCATSTLHLRCCTCDTASRIALAERQSSQAGPNRWSRQRA